MALSNLANQTLTVFKWPLALLSVLMIPGALLGLFELLKTIFSDAEPMLGFLLGGVIYFILDQVLFKRRFMGSSLSTLEHEFTHAIFAWSTGHRVTGLKVTWRSGGHVLIEGGGNWLIAVAPYWFPTLSVIWVILCSFVTFDRLWLSDSILGATFIYHQLSTYRETHSEQSDFQVAGPLFSKLFLPCANLLAAGWVLASAYGGISLGWQFIAQVLQKSVSLYGIG